MVGIFCRFLMFRFEWELSLEIRLFLLCLMSDSRTGDALNDAIGGLDGDPVVNIDLKFIDEVEFRPYFSKASFSNLSSWSFSGSAVLGLKPLDPHIKSLSGVNLDLTGDSDCGSSVLVLRRR